MASTIVIRQRRSANGSDRAQRETLRTLGLRGIGSTSQRKDDPAIRGMLSRVSHLVSVEQDAAGGEKSDG